MDVGGGNARVAERGDARVYHRRGAAHIGLRVWPKTVECLGDIGRDEAMPIIRMGLLGQNGPIVEARGPAAADRRNGVGRIKVPLAAAAEEQDEVATNTPVVGILKQAEERGTARATGSAAAR